MLAVGPCSGADLLKYLNFVSGVVIQGNLLTSVSQQLREGIEGFGGICSLSVVV